MYSVFVNSTLFIYSCVFPKYPSHDLVMNACSPTNRTVLTAKIRAVMKDGYSVDDVL